VCIKAKLKINGFERSSVWHYDDTFLRIKYKIYNFDWDGKEWFLRRFRDC